MVLFLGVRPEGERTSPPFLLPVGLELSLAASSAPQAGSTALSFLDSYFAARLRLSREVADADLCFDAYDLSTEDRRDEDFPL